MMTETVRSRFVNYLSEKGLTKTYAEKAAGLVRGSLSQPGELKVDKILALKKAFPELSLMWLISGEGEQTEPRVESTESSESMKKGNRAIDRLSLFVRWAKEQEIVKGEASFESYCGLSNKYLANSRNNGRGTIGSDIIARVYDRFPQLSLVWLITGRGDMIMEDQDCNIDYKRAYEGAVMQIAALNEIIGKTKG